MINKKEIHTLIVLGGRMEKDFALSFILSGRWDKIIAVDGGLEAVEILGLIPDYCCGWRASYFT